MRNGRSSLVLIPFSNEILLWSPVVSPRPPIGASLLNPNGDFRPADPLGVGVIPPMKIPDAIADDHQDQAEPLKLITTR